MGKGACSGRAADPFAAVDWGAVAPCVTCAEDVRDAEFQRRAGDAFEVGRRPQIAAVDWSGVLGGGIGSPLGVGRDGGVLWPGEPLHREPSDDPRSGVIAGTRAPQFAGGRQGDGPAVSSALRRDSLKRTAFGPVEREWVRGVRKALGGHGDVEQLRRVLSTLSDRHPLPASPPDRHSLQSSGPGRFRLKEIWPSELGVEERCAGCRGGGDDRFYTGAIDITVPCDFLPDDPSEEGMYFMWSPYTTPSTRAGWANFGLLRGLIDSSRWTAGTASGQYPGWQSGWGRNYNFVQHMLQLVYCYRSLLPNRWPTAGVVPVLPLSFTCEDLEDFIFEKFSGFVQTDVEEPDITPDGRFFLQIDGDGEEEPCPEYDDGQLVETFAMATCERTFSVAQSWPIGANLPFRGETGGGIRMCPSYINGMALVADRFLYWGNRAYWHATGGGCSSFVEALQMLSNSVLCGKVSLGAFAVPSRTLVHELAHAAGFGSHCDFNCCQAGLAGIWYARTRALLGLPQVDYDTGMVDTSFSSKTASYSSTCLAVPSTPFVLDLEFTNLGVAGDSQAYTVSSATWPTSCSPDVSPGIP